MSGLKPCPFCGSYERHICQIPTYYKINPHIWYVKCDTCEAQGARHFTEAGAIAAWNSRAKSTCELIRHGALANIPSFICWSCSECGFAWHHSENDRQFSYCPNCGCKVMCE